GVSIYLSSAQCGTGPTLHAVLLPAAAIGLTTFLCTAAGFFLTGRLHRFPTFHLEAGAGLILIGLGVKMLCDHLC
ncbi:manganese efflux pump, partial [uncultured Akkermansia sp.]